MRKLMAMAIALLVIGMTGAAVMAQDLGSQGSARMKIHRLGALGYGLAVSQSNPMEFELIKVGIAGVKAAADDNETEEIRVGVLVFGEDKYILKDVVIGNGSVTAKIYEVNDTNSTSQKGSISLNSYVKGEREVWAGALVLDGVTYNAYVIQAPRVWKPAEKAEKVFDYCKNNPARCMATVKAVGKIICDPTKEGVSCSERIKTFCESNPDDSRCKSLRLAYCKTNLDDANCRAELIEKCKTAASGDECDRLVNMYDKYAEKKAEVLKNAPGWIKNVRDRVKARIQRGENIEADTSASAEDD